MSRINFTKEQIEEIIKLYEIDKWSYKRIGEKFGVSITPIIRVLKENDVKIRTPEKKKKEKEVPQEHIDKIVYNYVNCKKGLVPSGAEFGYSQEKIKKILKNAGIRIRTYVEAKDLTRKYTINDNFFKHQTHNMAYILGFIAADGNVAKKENGVFIEVHEQDRELLEDIRKITNNSRPLTFYNHLHPNSETITPVAKFATWSSTWKKDLAVYNIVPAKTFILKPPTFLDKKFCISYIKGYFDGDGCITERQYGCQASVIISGASKELIFWIKEFLANEYGIIGGYHIAPASTGTKMYNINYNKIESLLTLRQLWYENPELTLGLERKKEKFYLIKE